MHEHRAKRAITRISRFFAYTLIAVAIGFALLLVAQRVFNPFHVVISDSMAPQLKTGDAVIVKDLDPDQVKVGEVIVFSEPQAEEQQFIVHRVVSIEEQEGHKVFITKGDNNPVVDDWRVTSANLAGGVAVNFPRFGSFINFLESPKGYLSLVIFPALFAIVVAVMLGVIEKSEEAEALARERGHRYQAPDR